MVDALLHLGHHLLLACLEWINPAKPWKTAEVLVCAVQCAVMLKRQRCILCVGHCGTMHANFFQNTLQLSPVRVIRMQNAHIRQCQQSFYKLQNLTHAFMQTS